MWRKIFCAVISEFGVTQEYKEENFHKFVLLKLIVEFILRYRSYEKKSKFFIHSIQKADFD